jgi:hypothetical protein
MTKKREEYIHNLVEGYCNGCCPLSSIAEETFFKKLTYVMQYPEMIEAIYDVLKMGEAKHGNTWLNEDGPSMSRKSNFDSKNHHAAKHFSGQLLDESGLFHLAHEGTRSLMELTRIKRGLIHTDDKPKSIPADGSNCLDLEDALQQYKNSQYSRPEEDK